MSLEPLSLLVEATFGGICRGKKPGGQGGPEEVLALCVCGHAPPICPSVNQCESVFVMGWGGSLHVQDVVVLQETEQEEL